MCAQGMDLESLRNMEKGYTLQMQRAKDKVRPRTASKDIILTFS